MTVSLCVESINLCVVRLSFVRTFPLCVCVVRVNDAVNLYRIFYACIFVLF